MHAKLILALVLVALAVFTGVAQPVAAGYSCPKQETETCEECCARIGREWFTDAYNCLCPFTPNDLTGGAPHRKPRRS